MTFQNKTIVFPRAPVELLYCCEEYGYHTLSEQEILHPEHLTSNQLAEAKARNTQLEARLARMEEGKRA